MIKNIAFISVLSGLSLMASEVKSEEDRLVISDPKTGRKIILGSQFTSAFDRDIFGLHFLEKDGSHDVLIDSDDGTPSVRMFADGKEVFYVLASSDKPTFALTYGKQQVGSRVTENESIVFSGSLDCFEKIEGRAKNRCNVTVNNFEDGTMSNVVFEDGEAIFGYGIMEDGNVRDFSTNKGSGLTNSEMIDGVGVAIQGYCAIFGCE